MLSKVQLCILRDYDIAPQDQYSCQIYNYFYHKYSKQLIGLDKTQIMHTIQRNYFGTKYITKLAYWYSKYQRTNHSRKIGNYIVKELDNPNGLIHRHHRHKHQPVIKHQPNHKTASVDDVIKSHMDDNYDNRVHILTGNGKQIVKYQ